MYHEIVPSLQYLATVKTTAVLWVNPITIEANKFLKTALLQRKNTEWDIVVYHFVRDKWEKIERNVTLSALSIILPKTVKELIMCYIKPIGEELQDWIKQHENILCNSICFSKILGGIQWTSSGRIDRIGTAKFLIQTEVFDNVNSFKLASYYYFEESIADLWNKLTENEKVLLKNRQPCDNVNYWVSVKSDQNNEWNNIDIETYNYLFHRSGDRNNLAGIKYFWDKISLSYKEIALFNWLMFGRSRTSPDIIPVLNFMLAKLSDDQRSQLFQVIGEEILIDFLRQRVVYAETFMEVANMICPHLLEKSFQTVLVYITEKYISKNVNYFDVNKLYADFKLLNPRNMYPARPRRF